MGLRSVNASNGNGFSVPAKLSIGTKKLQQSSLACFLPSPRELSKELVNAKTLLFLTTLTQFFYSAGAAITFKINSGSPTGYIACIGNEPLQLPFYTQRVIDGVVQAFNSSLDSLVCFMIEQTGTQDLSILKKIEDFLDGINVSDIVTKCLAYAFGSNPGAKPSFSSNNGYLLPNSHYSVVTFISNATSAITNMVFNCLQSNITRLMPDPNCTQDSSNGLYFNVPVSNGLSVTSLLILGAAGAIFAGYGLFKFGQWAYNNCICCAAFKLRTPEERRQLLAARRGEQQPQQQLQPQQNPLLNN